MARTLSTIKYHRQSLVRRDRNRAVKSTIRTFTKKALAAAGQGDFETAAKYQKVVQGLVDKASKGSAFHKNTAARKKSRLASRIRTMREGAQA
ncbi:MAG: 30S ribosomal protein S20 [Trueperaceae bacterium]